MESSANIDELTRAGATGRADRAPAAERWRSALTTRRLLPFVLMSAVFALTVAPATDPDFWWHLRTGQFIAETRTVPRADIFSHTAAGREWVAHEWLTELLMFGVFKAAGWAGLIALFSLVMTAALWLAYRRAFERAPHPTPAGAAVLLATLACAPILGVRPQMISFLLTSAFVLLLGRYARGRGARSLWPLPALMLVWVNMHGAFALGLALVGATVVGVALDELFAPSDEGARDDEARKEETREEASGTSSARRRLRGMWSAARPLCVVLAACAAVVPLNPNGARLFTYPLETIASGAMQRHIQEWLSPDFHRAEALPFALLLLATFAALALSPRRPRPSELLLLGVSAYAALRSWRNIPFFALVAAPLLAEHAWLFVASRTRRRDVTGKRENAKMPALQLILNATLFVVIPAALCVVSVARTAGSQESVEAEKYPAAAVEFLRGHKQAGPIFNAYGWGGYLVWKLHPERAVYIDGRADVYGDELVEDYLRAESGEPGWRELLERDGVRVVMIAPHAPLASLLREDEGWDDVYEDGQAVIFFKR